MTGDRFYRWTVLSEQFGLASHPKVRCRCDCGTERNVDWYSLKGGGTKSCGCFRGEAAAKNNATHGHSRVGKMTPTYRSWQLMQRRCSNPNSEDYADYGGAGISICERWLSFENFFADMGERPVGTTLDRYPNGSGNYEPENCRWATASEQAINRKSTRWIEHDGRRLCLKQWAEELGVDRGTIANRLARGKGVDGRTHD